MSDYIPQEFPKWVGDIVVSTRAEERALMKSAKVILVSAEEDLGISAEPAEPSETVPV